MILVPSRAYFLCVDEKKFDGGIQRRMIVENVEKGNDTVGDPKVSAPRKLESLKKAEILFFPFLHPI